MDWQKVTRFAQQLSTLDDEAALENLNDSKLSENHRELLRSHFNQSKDNVAFMKTFATGDGAPAYSYGPNDIVGNWQVVDPIGMGGMGEVYKATRADGSYEQTVALKIMQGANLQRLTAFENERRLLAQMEHPNISRIIDGGMSADNLPYVVMEYVQGQSITDFVARHNLAVASCLRLFVDLCNAVSHAHGKLILHKDIKADNVMVDQSGQLRLIDFGLSSVMSDIQAGGGFSLMSAAPEQLLRQPLSVATDVFSLGVLLHQLLTGAYPDRRPDAAMAPSGDLKPELKAIISKTLQLKPKDRYQSVDGLSNDVLAYMLKRPVLAYGAGRRYRTLKFFRRNPISSLATTAFVISLLSGMTLTTYFAKRAKAEANAVQEQLNRSEYFLKKSNVQIGMGNMMLDAMQRVVGATGGEEIVTETLLKRWQEGFDLREEDPKGAAQISFAIGRYFLFRNDYVTADKILSAWIAEDFGSETILYTGKGFLGSTKLNMGERQEAAKLFREARDYYANGYMNQSPDHIAMATNVALITEEPTDIAEAERLVRLGLEVDEYGPSIKMFYWFQIAKMRLISKDFEGGLQAYRETYLIHETFPLMEMQGRDTAILTLAATELYMGRSLMESEQKVDFIIDEWSKTKGESRGMATAHKLKSHFLIKRGELVQAAEHIAKAKVMQERFSGITGAGYTDILMVQAELKAMSGEYKEAEDILKSVPNDTNRYKLAKAFLINEELGNTQANDFLRTAELDAKKVSQSPLETFLLKRLEANGVNTVVP